MKTKRFIISFIFSISALVFIAKLFYIQVIDDSFKLSAENNTLRHVTIYPSRGFVFDRTGKIIVANQSTYDLKVVPRSIEAFDTVTFCNLIGISKKDLVSVFKKKKYSYKPVILKKQINGEEYARIAENLYKYPGFYTEKRSLRTYPFPVAANVLGYLGEVNVDELKNDTYYQSGDYVGKSGIEKVYETDLRGDKGTEVFMVDVLGRVQGPYKKGSYNKQALAGKNIVSSLDIELQKLGEFLMQNKIGSIVAIEPLTGEILAMVTSPTYDPNLFIGKKLAENYRKIEYQKNKPLFNRTLRSMYPPGSTFKPINALIALQKGLITDRTVFVLNGYDAGTHIVKDHVSGAVSFKKSIQMSSNAYYCTVLKLIISDKRFENYANAYEDWRTYVKSFGLATKLGTDLDFEKQGILYSHKYYDRYYGKGHWNYNTIISLAIGQGELGFTPLQTANMTAIIANKGWYIIPHIVKDIGAAGIDKKYKEKHYSKVNEKYYQPVKDAMEAVVSGGTGMLAYVPGLDICGKTGTAQNPHGKDHSVFIAFAPKDNPKIAVSVYVENAGYGSTWAAPIASMIIEKYLTDSISRPWLLKRISEANLIKNK
ncbi:MAG: penicillin-binding protein 2 [Bacteroidetes bacterium]|nr:MAG: penicillin-binding protein 2 [Bacteroidota bacterium]